MISMVREINTFSGETTLSALFASILERGPLLKEKKHLALGANSAL